MMVIKVCYSSTTRPQSAPPENPIGSFSDGGGLNDIPIFIQENPFLLIYAPKNTRDLLHMLPKISKLLLSSSKNSQRVLKTSWKTLLQKSPSGATGVKLQIHRWTLLYRWVGPFSYLAGIQGGAYVSSGIYSVLWVWQ